MGFGVQGLRFSSFCAGNQQKSVFKAPGLGSFEDTGFFAIKFKGQSNTVLMSPAANMPSNLIISTCASAKLCRGSSYFPNKPQK